MIVAVLVSLALAGTDPADDALSAPTPAPTAAPTPAPSVERGPPESPDDEDEDEDEDKVHPGAPVPAAPQPGATSGTTHFDPADPVAPATPAPAATTPAPAATTPQPAGPSDPADIPGDPATTAPAPPRRAPPGVRAITRTPSPDIQEPIVAGGIVAGAGCIAALAPLVGFTVCPYSFSAAPLTGCCGTIAAAAIMETQHEGGGAPIPNAIAASVGVAAATAVGVVGGTGLYFLTGNSANGYEILVGAVGGLVAMTILGPVAGGGAVALYKTLNEPESPPAQP